MARGEHVVIAVALVGVGDDGAGWHGVEFAAHTSGAFPTEVLAVDGRGFLRHDARTATVAPSLALQIFGARISHHIVLLHFSPTVHLTNLFGVAQAVEHTIHLPHHLAACRRGGTNIHKTVIGNGIHEGEHALRIHKTADAKHQCYQ